MAKRVFSSVGWALAALGCSLVFVLLGYLGGATITTLDSAGFNGMGHFLAATAGSAMIGWGTILLIVADRPALHSPVAIGTGAGFLALSLMRFAVVLDGDPAFTPFAAVLTGEVVLLLVLSILFFQIGADFWARLKDGFWSLLAAPIWVQVWVWTCLLTVNTAAFVLYALTKHPLPGWAALGFMFVVLTNMTLVLYERGISKLTSLPHLIP